MGNDEVDLIVYADGPDGPATYYRRGSDFYSRGGYIPESKVRKHPEMGNPLIEGRTSVESALLDL